MFGQKEHKDSENYHAIVSAHIYLDDDGDKDIEIFNFIDSDYNRTEIFEDIDYTLMEMVDAKLTSGRKSYFFMAHIRSWFHTYYDYFDVRQSEVESEVKVLDKIEDFVKLSNAIKGVVQE